MTEERIVQVEGKFGAYQASLVVSVPAGVNRDLIRVGFLGAIDKIEWGHSADPINTVNVTLWNTTLDPFRTRRLVSVAVVDPVADWQHQPEPHRIWCEFLLP